MSRQWFSEVKFFLYRLVLHQHIFIRLIQLTQPSFYYLQEAGVRSKPLRNMIISKILSL